VKKLTLTKEMSEEVRAYSERISAEPNETARVIFELGTMFLQQFLDGNRVFYAEKDSSEMVEVVFEPESEEE
jgi:hypothetical protein